MTLEELTAQFAEFQNTAKEALDAQAREIAALKAKNAELIGEKRGVRDDKRSLEETLERLLGTKKTKGEDGDEGDPQSGRSVRKRVEAETNERIKALEDRNAKLERENNEKAIGAALDDALQALPAATRKVVKAFLKSEKKIEVVNSEVLCDGKDVRDSVREWLATPEGKAFIPAPANGGSAAPGGASGATPIKPRSKMTHAEKGEYIRVHGLPAYNSLPA